MYGSRAYIIKAFNDLDDVPPEWVLAFEKQCGKARHPHWFYLHLRNIYGLGLLFGGIILGVTVDSLLLGGTIIASTKTNEDNWPLLGVVRWIILGIFWFGIGWLWEYFIPGSMRNLWIKKLWMCICAFLIFSVFKYLWKATGLSKPYVTYLEVEEKWNDHNDTAAEN